MYAEQQRGLVMGEPVDVDQPDRRGLALGQVSEQAFDLEPGHHPGRTVQLRLLRDGCHHDRAAVPAPAVAEHAGQGCVRVGVGLGMADQPLLVGEQPQPDVLHGVVGGVRASGQLQGPAPDPGQQPADHLVEPFVGPLRS